MKTPPPITSRLTVKVVPGASQNKIVGLHDNAVKVRVQAPPEKGKANEAVIKLIADYLGLPVKNITLCIGHTSKTKILEIQDLSGCDLAERLSALSDAEPS